MKPRGKKVLACLAAGAFLGACSSSSDNDDMSTVTLEVTDAPVDELAAVHVMFTGVEFQGSGERIEFEFDEPRVIDLLALSGGDTEGLLIDEAIPPDDYQWIRLQVQAEQGEMDSWVEQDDGGEESLFIPGGAQSGLQLNGPFTLTAGQGASFVVDFDLRKSVNNPQGFPDYRLRPTLRIIDVIEAGSIAGTVDPAFLALEDCAEMDAPATGAGAAVYVFEGPEAEPVDIDIDGGNGGPVTTAPVTLDESAGEFVYTAAFLMPGEYTVAFTCQASLDDPEAADDIEFVEAQDVTVEAGETTEADFILLQPGEEEEESE